MTLMDFVYQPEHRGAARRVHQLHHAGAGRPRRSSRRTRPRRPGGRQDLLELVATSPLVFPSAADFAKLHRYRSSTPARRTEWDAHLRADLPVMIGIGAHAPGWSPYRAGPARQALWLVMLLRRADAGDARRCRLMHGRPRSTVSSRPSHWQNYSDACPVPRAVHPVARSTALISTVLLHRDRLPGGVLDRLPRRRAQVSLYLFLLLLPFFVSFVLRTQSWNYMLADNGIILSPLKDLRAAAAELPRARHAGRGDRRAHLQLPAVHGSADLRRAGTGRPGADRGVGRPLRDRRSRRSGGWSSRCRCPASSPACC